MKNKRKKEELAFKGMPASRHRLGLSWSRILVAIWIPIQVVFRVSVPLALSHFF